MTASSKHYAIVGGGVIGLTIAWRLAQAGATVSVFERDRCARGASWAAAGMLAAAAETGPGAETFFALARASRERWGSFASELESASGISIGYSGGSTLVAAQSEEAANHLRATAKHLRGLDEPVRLLTADDAKAAVPELAEDVQLALLSPKDGQVENRALGDALVVACSRAGVRIYENQPVQGIVLAGDAATGLNVGGHDIAFDGVVLCAGAWTSEDWAKSILGVGSVGPVKGQMLALESETVELAHIVWGQGVYIVPRGNCRIIIGATTEDAGFDVSVNAATIQDLHARATDVIPALGEAEIVESWAGLRPGSADELPLMGPAGPKGLWLASGHFRNGILLAPITGDLMVTAMLTGDTPGPLWPFLPTRFG